MFAACGLIGFLGKVQHLNWVLPGHVAMAKPPHPTHGSVGNRIRLFSKV